MKRRAIVIGRFVLSALLLYALAAGGCAKRYDRRLTECDRSNPVETPFACPRGENHQILLGVPKAGEPPSFAGHMLVVDQKNNEVVYDFAFAGGGGAGGCNWLDEYDLDGYLLTWNEKGALKPKHNYRLTVRFSKPPPPGSSLWLCWINDDLFPLY